jgi:hypothetical protein
MYMRCGELGLIHCGFVWCWVLGKGGLSGVGLLSPPGRRGETRWKPDGVVVFLFMGIWASFEVTGGWGVVMIFGGFLLYFGWVIYLWGINFLAGGCFGEDTRWRR